MQDKYVSPFSERYSSDKMQYIFSPDFKFETWRKLWIALAEAEKELGINISDEQIAEMKANVQNIDYEFAKAKEKEVRHDVMAHVLAFGKVCPKAKPIIHLGATSCYVGDNTEVIVLREALLLIRKELVTLIAKVRDFACKYKGIATLGYTHFQAAQPTTVGKRATLWLQDLVMDLETLDFELGRLKLLGCKGTTGTAASFLSLFDGDVEKVKQLDKLIASKMNFDETFDVSGQTYTRKQDANVLRVLQAIAESATKFSNDIRLLSHEKEVEEPFEDGQIGSSAMAYKRNPMRSERIASISRYVIVSALNPSLTASGQWLERTLDDSANKRISTSEAFLAVDAILALYTNIIGGLSVYPKIIEKHLREELPFMATENILMFCVKEKGKDRQVLHEAIRRHSVEAAKVVKEQGGQNDLLDRILNDKQFGLTKAELDKLVDVKAFTGMAEKQVDDYLENVVNPLIENNKGDIITAEEIKY